MYQRYFESLTSREVSEKQKEEQTSAGEERSRAGYHDGKEKEGYRSRERETSHRTSPEERGFPPEEPLRDRSSVVTERHYGGRKMEADNLSDDALREEFNRKHGHGDKFSQRSRERDRSDPSRNFEERIQSRRVQTPENERQQHRHEIPSHSSGREKRNDFRYGENEHSSFKVKHERSSGHSDGDTAVDERWKPQGMRADLENTKTGRKDVSVKDRLSFVKREPGITHSKREPAITHSKREPATTHSKREPAITHSRYDPGYDYDRKQLEKNLNESRFSVDNRRQTEQHRLKERLDFDRTRERQKERSVESRSRRDDQPREFHGKREVKVCNREEREERNECRGARDIESQNSPVSSESESELMSKKSTHRKREHSKSKGRRGDDSYESEREGDDNEDDKDDDDSDDDDGDDSERKRHRKRRKNGKKKKDERSSDRKHKHKKKKKKKDSRRE